MSVLKEEGHRDRREVRGKTQVKTGFMLLQAKGHLGATTSWKGKQGSTFGAYRGSVMALPTP